MPGSSRFGEREGEVVHRADEVRRRRTAPGGRVRHRRTPRAPRRRPRRPRATRPGAPRARRRSAGRSPGRAYGSRQSWIRSRTSPNIVRAMRPCDRRARRAALLDRDRHLRRPPVRRGRPAARARCRRDRCRCGSDVAIGSTISRRIPFMPCVSETLSPNPTRRMVENPAVIARRGHGRVSRVPGARFDPTTMAGPSGAVRRGSTTSTNVGIEVVDVEHHDDVAPRREQSLPHRLAVVGDRPGQHDHGVVVGGEGPGVGEGRIGRTVLDHHHLEVEAAVAQRADQHLQRLVDEPGLVVRGHHHRQLGRGVARRERRGHGG